MNPPHVQRSLISLVLILIAAIILAGTLHASASVSTASSDTATVIVQTDNTATLTPTPLPAPARVSADTTGIIALSIVIVTTIIVGAVMGLRKFSKKKSS